MRYQCNPKTTIRAKVNSAGLVSACAVNKCCDKVSVTVTAAVRTFSFQSRIEFEDGREAAT